MNEFHFLRPAFLWLSTIPIVYIIGVLLSKHMQNKARGIVPEMAPYLMSTSSGYKEIVFRCLPALGIAVGIVALAGPTWEKYAAKQPEQQTISLIINLPTDCSAHDVARMKVATYHLLDSLRTESVSLYVQSGSTHVLIPYTDDYRLISSYLEFVSPEIMPLAGDHMEEIATVTTAPDGSSFHSVVYLTPEMPAEKVALWDNLKLESDYKIVLTTQRRNMADHPDIIPIGANNEGVASAITSLRHDAEQKIHNKALQDSTQWKDMGYLFCIPATLLLLPLFFRYEKSLFLFVAVASLSSCSYTEQMWNEAQVNFYLMKKDTLNTIYTSDDPFRRGTLWAEQQEYAKAAAEFAQDTTCEASYNRGLSLYHSGYFMEALSVLKSVEKEMPEWEFVAADIKVIEKLIASGVTERVSPKDWSDGSDSDSFEKDPDNKQRGDDAELWADKLVNETSDMMNYRNETSPKQGEVLFRQIENDPKKFIKRRLEYEHTHKD